MSRRAHLIAVVLAVGASSATPGRAGAQPGPSPELSPRRVVRIQLDALQSNPTSNDDAGIRTAFRFASPENRAQTGPIDRFIQMVKGAAYAPLLGFAASETKVLSREPARAEVAVVVEDGSGAVTGFVWILGKQKGGAHDGCWMTDAVFRVPLDEGEAPSSDDPNAPIEI